MNIVDGFAVRLADTSMDLRSKLNVATELREVVEIHQVSPDVEQFMTLLLPELLRLLRQLPVNMYASSPEHKLRHCLLDVLARLQPNDALKPAAEEILQLVMKIIETDNEENGVLCMKIITNLYRAYKQQLESYVQPFFDLVVQIISNVPGMVQELFGQPQPAPQTQGNSSSAVAPGTSPSNTSNNASGSGPGSVGPTSVASGAGSPDVIGTPAPQSQERPLFKATHSFRVLTECPIIIVLLYSTHRHLISASLPVFIPHVIETLSLEATAQAKEHQAAAAKGEIFCGVAPAIRQSIYRQAYNDFVMAQIKITSFLAYALRAFSGALHQHYTLVPNFVVRLLKDCPPEMSSARKELLVSMRHILSTEFRTFFIAKVTTLLEERVLIGSGLTAYENLRPLAYSTMADLIHHVRNELSSAQIWKTVRVFTKNLHDNTLATSFQIMSAKLLLNFLDRITGMQEHQESRQILLVIMKAFVDRFEMLNKSFFDDVKVIGDGDSSLSLKSALEKSVIIKVHAEIPNTELKDARYVFKNLIHFLKNLIYGFKSTNPPPPASSNIPGAITPQQWQEVARMFNYDDVLLFRRLLREGLRGMAFFSVPESNGTVSPAEKEIMEAFISVFVHLDLATFNEIFSAEMNYLFKAIVENHSLLHFTQLLAGNETTSANFCANLLQFLMEHLPEIGNGGEESVVISKLFKQCFSAVNLFPATNEAVILPHLKSIIVDSLELARGAKEPEIYFSLLQQLFRNLGGGRFDSVYKTVLPLLQVLLESLNRRLEAARTREERNLYADLCLTVPVRLSLLVPHLSWLMKPLVVSVGPESTPELVSQGLRTLELCVDNLTASYFDPIIEPVIEEVMSRLWKHLKPLPYDHKLSHTTFRVLGKLGGRNRAFIRPPSDLKGLSALDQDVAAMLGFENADKADVHLRITPGIQSAINLLSSSTTPEHYRNQAYQLIRVTLLKMFPTDTNGLSAGFVRGCAQSTGFADAPPLPDGSDCDLNARSRSVELCEELLKSVFMATENEKLREDARKLILDDLCEQFVLLELAEFSIERRRALRPFVLEEYEGKLYCTPRALATAVIYALSHPSEEVQETGRLAVRRIWDTGRILCGPDMESYRYPMVRGLFAKFSHSCFEETWHLKAGAVRGLSLMLRELSLAKAWLAARQVELTRTLFFVIKDSSLWPEVPHYVAKEASELLLYIIRQCPHTPGERPFTMLTSLLAFELESTSQLCRTTTQQCLEIIAEVTGISLSEIIKGVTDVFLTPIFMKPLRALPFPMQIGYIDAVSYCLGLPNTFMVFNDKLTRLLDEALALVDAEDESLTSAHRVFEYTTSKQLADLRVVCIKLLALAVTTGDHLAVHQPAMRSKIIAVFFKTLSSSSKPAVEAAHEGLREVLRIIPKLPKDLLQNGLRPILVNLSDYKRLSVQGLDGLARLLELLTYYFKVEIGKKLLDHLQAWTEPARLVPISNKLLDGDERIQIAVAILNVFHLLPPTAHMFIPNIMSALTNIESTLRRVQTSPLRKPVATFLDRHAAEAYAYFADKLTDPIMGRMFSDMLVLAPALREHTKSNVEELCGRIAQHDQELDQCVGICNLVFVMKSIGESEDGRIWLAKQRKTILSLISSLGDILRATASLPPSSPRHMEVSVAIADLQHVILASEPDVDLLMIAINALTAASAEVSLEFLEHFYSKIALSESKDIHLDFLDKAIEQVTRPGPGVAKQWIMKAVNVLLVVQIHRHGSLEHMDGPWLKQVHAKIWKATQATTAVQQSLDRFHLMVLEMSTLLVRSAQELVSSTRKDVIKYGWAFIKVDDIVSKVSAHVLVASFISVFDSLPKIVVQIYASLLKTSQPEAKSLVTQALDILGGVLVQRIQSPLWAKWPRRVLGEDGHGIVPVSNVCLFIARHASMFYPYRELYVPFVVSAIAKLSVMPTITLDIDLAELLASWESQRASEESGYQVPLPQKDTVIVYLVRYICNQNQRVEENANGKRVLAAVNTLLGLWHDVEVRLDFFDRSLVQADLSQPQAQIQAFNAMEVVSLALKHKPKEWITENSEALVALLDKALGTASLDAHTALAPILKIALPSSEELFKASVTAIEQHLSQTPPPPGWVLMATEVVAVRPAALDSQFPQIIKALGRNVKDAIDSGSSTATTTTTTVATSNGISTPVTPSDTTLLIKLLELIASRISHLGDQRRAFLTLVAQLIERVPDLTLCHHILKMARHWVFSHGVEIFPTVREKAAILHKLLIYRDRPELGHEYFELIIDIFRDAELRKTELPARLEQPFLIGTAQSDIQIHKTLLDILSSSVEPQVSKRLPYVFTEQNWEALADKQWLNQALQQVFGGLSGIDKDLEINGFSMFPPVGNLELTIDPDSIMEVEDNTLDEFLNRRRVFLEEIASIKTRSYVTPLLELMFVDKKLVHESWQDVLPGLYSNLNPKEKHELTKGLCILLAKDYHLRQADQRPNVVQTLLQALSKCDHVPPQLAKFLASNYDAWYPALELCDQIKDQSTSEPVVACANDTLAELYAAIGESDAFYGLWRTRSMFTLTNSALSFEQCGMWSRAMSLHETAQIKARSGVLPFSDSEYSLWEDHWVLCAEKLQHWDVLADIAKHEGFSDLLLECAWRQAEWLSEREPLEQTIKSLMDAPTPRRQVFETFLCVQGFAQKTESLQRLSQSCDEGIQLVLRKWHGLPERPTGAHIPLLHEFQQYVEFMEASQVYTSLAATTAVNLETKSQELKGVMQAWHDRLPNMWDDINIWGDLATWRQHVFGVINRVYLPLINQMQQHNGNSAAYRGYHEIAWTINRFAHIARKHNMPEVCVNLLAKIYTLPNIEIQEAFLKLREQAKCHLANPAELQTGLEVISNTNLAFFGNAQKSEFFALKGMSLARLGAEDLANEAFSTAVQIDVYLPKAWAEWGAFNDRRFKQHPEQMVYGSAAIVCYLHAAGIYKNSKCRKLLGRILWLLSLDDAHGSIASAFENFKGETPTWYWCTYIPQLLTSLSQKEARFTARILAKIAKIYPQALHFHLRTAREEYAVLQRVSVRRQAAAQTPTENTDSPNSQSVQSPATANAAPTPSSMSPPQEGAFPGTSGSPAPNAANPGAKTKQPWEYVEEIMGVLKTAYPLLALSLETLIDQMYHRFKSQPDEDAYRLIVALLNDGLSFMGRQQYPRKDLRLPPQTEANVSRFAEDVIPVSCRPLFEADFVHPRPDLDTYIARLRKWRDRLEARLDARPEKKNLEALSPPLSEFHYSKFEDVEVPGQNMELKDNNHHFIKIGRFIPHVDQVRNFGICYRRLTFQGHDGSLHPFAVQYPAARHCRREERMSQVFRILNAVIARRTECRARNLQFTLPVAVPLNTHIRLVQDNSHYKSFYQIYEQYCKEHGQNRDAPFDYTVQQARAAFDPRLPKPDVSSVKMEIMTGIQSKFVPPTIMLDFFTHYYRGFEEFWLFRKQFAYQYAGVTFMTIMMTVNNRYPHKFLVNLKSGNVWATEMLPILPANKVVPTFLNGEPVALRLTPNLQTLMGPTILEGVFAMSVMIIAKGLTDPEFDLQQFLPVFVRDELMMWVIQQRPQVPEQQLRDIVRVNVDAISRRASSLAQISQGNIPANQTVIDLISLAVNPRNLALTDILWMPYF